MKYKYLFCAVVYFLTVFVNASSPDSSSDDGDYEDTGESFDDNIAFMEHNDIQKVHDLVPPKYFVQPKHTVEKYDTILSPCKGKINTIVTSRQIFSPGEEIGSVICDKNNKIVKITLPKLPHNSAGGIIFRYRNVQRRFVDKTDTLFTFYPIHKSFFDKYQGESLHRAKSHRSSRGHSSRSKKH